MLRSCPKEIQLSTKFTSPANEKNRIALVKLNLSQPKSLYASINKLCNFQTQIVEVCHNSKSSTKNKMNNSEPHITKLPKGNSALKEIYFTSQRKSLNTPGTGTCASTCTQYGTGTCTVQVLVAACTVNYFYCAVSGYLYRTGTVLVPVLRL